MRGTARRGTVQCARKAGRGKLWAEAPACAVSMGSILSLWLKWLIAASSSVPISNRTAAVSGRIASRVMPDPFDPSLLQTITLKAAGRLAEDGDFARTVLWSRTAGAG